MPHARAGARRHRPDVRAMAAFALGLIGDAIRGGRAGAALDRRGRRSCPRARRRSARPHRRQGRGAGDREAWWRSTRRARLSRRCSPTTRRWPRRAGGGGLQAGVVCARAAQGVRPAGGGGARPAVSRSRRGGRSRTRCSASRIRAPRLRCCSSSARRALHARVRRPRARHAEGRRRPSSRCSRCSSRQRRPGWR